MWGLVRARQFFRLAKSFVRGPSGGPDAVGLPFGECEIADTGGLEAGDAHGVVPVVVQAEEAQVGLGAETGSAQWARIWSRRAAVMSWGRPGRAAGIHSWTAPLVGQGMHTCRPWRLRLPEQFGRFALPVRRRVMMRVPSIRTTSPAPLGDLLQGAVQARLASFTFGGSTCA